MGLGQRLALVMGASVLGPTLRGDKVLLRPPTDDDLRRVVSWFEDETVFRFARGRWLRPWGARAPRPDVDELRRWLADVTANESVTWAIEHDAKAIGMTQICEIETATKSARTHIVVGDRSAWGRGCATEAAHLRQNYAFDVLGLDKLVSATNAGNIPMRRVLQRNGYTQVGMTEHEGRRQVVFELTRSAWQQSRPAR